MIKISKTANSIQQSLTRQLFDKARKYDNVIDFTLGDPDFLTPQVVQKAACDAIKSGKTRYSENAGLPELRQAIANRIFQESGVNYKADEEILVSVGAMEALYLTLLCIVDEGDEVIIPAPYWINYEHMTLMCGGKPVIVDSKSENDFIVDVDDIKSAITEKTVAIIVNSPNNPTGAIFDSDTIKELCDIAIEKNIVLIWDECYKYIVYDGEKISTVLDYPEVKDNVVIINSCSKTFSMTGWRLGYMAAPKEIVAAATKLQENIAACASLPSQYAAIRAYNSGYDIIKPMVEGFKLRRNILIESINGIDKLSCKYPKGTFYAFVNIKETGLSSIEFAYKLLDSKQVAVVPGVTYGKCCEDYVRIAYTLSEDKIREGVKRIKEFVEEL